MDYIIGLIDEEESHLSTIRRILLLRVPEGNTVDLKVYRLEGQSDVLPKVVTEEVLSDIVHGNICSLIIDYKIMIQSALVEGTDIYKAIIDVVPKFPVVILTDVPSNCYNKPYVDADKVYWKKEFFKIEESYSKEKTENIFCNMEHYVRQRAELLAKLEDHKGKMTAEGFSPELYKEILDVEKSLDELAPQGQTQIDKALSTNELKEIVELLEKADNLLGDKHEE